MEHMTENDRIMIASFLDSGMEVKEIARMLNRDRTTICREIKGRRRMTVENRNGRTCPDLEGPPYVCNGCFRMNGCRPTKYMYSASVAQTIYRDTLRSSREGFNITFRELEDMGRLIADGLSRGQSLHHIMASCPDRFTVCEKTVYRLVRKGMLPGVRYHDLLRIEKVNARRVQLNARVHDPGV
jgi:IS30 family transposase